ncbi:MAG: carboxymuconolactone decarboxylase family protein [Pseudomonadota bacterium]
MHKDWSAITTELSALFQEVRDGIPDVARGFSSLANAANADGALSSKGKELMALAISIAVRCEGCIGFHAKAAAKHGATRQEVLETIGVSAYMGGGPSFTYGAQALEAFDQLGTQSK